jgi:glycerol transport system ATP-binding protein
MRLTLENINLRVGAEHHLYDIDLTLDSGSFNVLLGPTQAGKTSLLRIMAGLDRPTTGRVLADGKDVTGTSVRDRNVAMVYQQFVNYPSFTVFDNIASPLKLAKRFTAKEVERKVHAAAAMMHIEHLLDRLPAELSGGQQQRTAIARALTKDAGLLLLDEPLVNLDYKLREELRAEMRELFGKGSTTVVYATTEPLEALMLGGQTAVLDLGRLQQFGATTAVYHRPDNIRVAEVFSDPPINVLPAQLDAALCRISADANFARAEHMRGLAAGEYRVGIRANHVGVVADVPQSAAIPVEVELAEISGSETYIHGRHGDLILIARLQGVHDYGLGERITLYFDPARLFVFDPQGKLAAAPGPKPPKRRAA